MSVVTTFPADPALPALAELLSATDVSRRFEQDWPGAGARPAQVLGCSLHDVRYDPGVRCVTAWWLDVRLDDGPPERTVGVMEADGGGVRHRLHTADPVLPGLREACDASAMEERLGATIPGDPGSWTATPVRYRPGERAVVRYGLRARGRPVTLFGKLSPGGVGNLTATLASLHEVAGGAEGIPDVGAPLAVVEDLALLVQGEAPGRSLKEGLFGPGATPGRAGEQLRTAGRFLAGLHSCGLRPAVERTFPGDASQLRRALAEVRRISPDRGAALERSLDRVEVIGSEGSRPVPSHGSFRPDHLLFEGDRAYLVDLDGFCAADPALDLGNLLAHLAWRAIRDPGSASLLAGAEEALLAGYTTRLGEVDRRKLRAHQALTMVRIGVSRLRNLTVAEWHLLPRLASAAEELATVSSGGRAEVG